MIRLTWLQFRFQAIAAAFALVVVAAIVVITGREVSHLYSTSVVPCAAQGDCQAAYSLLGRQQTLLQSLLGPLLLIVPALLGSFWGAPLVARELESHTFQLAWTQSVTRNRWLAVKLALLGLASLAVAGVLSLAVTWWFGPFDEMRGNRFLPGVFDARDLVPLGYALFAFALGVTAGVLLRRTLPAMAVTLLAFLGARLAINVWVRPHFMTPAQVNLSLNAVGNLGFSPSPAGVTFVVAPIDPATVPNAWTLASKVVDQNGQAASPTALHQFLQTACPAIAAGPSGQVSGATHGPANQTTFNECIARLSTQFHLVVTYQPAGRYWTFQCIELALFVGLAVLLAGGCFLWLRRAAI